MKYHWPIGTDCPSLLDMLSIAGCHRMRRRCLPAVLLVFALAGTVAAQRPDDVPSGRQLVTIPAGTHIVVVAKLGVNFKDSKPGDRVFFQTDFPVIVDKKVVVPAGTYVQAVFRSYRRDSETKAQHGVEIGLSEVMLSSGNGSTHPALVDQSSVPASSQAGAITNGATTLVLLISDRGWIESWMPVRCILQTPLVVEPESLAAPTDSASGMRSSGESALALLAHRRRLCRTPDIPGTSDTVITGADGTTQTVISGTPPIPGRFYACP